jgi:hypothetical protein
MSLTHRTQFHTTALELAVVVLATCLPSVVQAQDRAEFQSWTAVMTTGTLLDTKPSPAVWLDTHARRGNAGSLLIVRPALGVEFADWISAWAGYAWIPVFADEDSNPVHEHRAWQQAILQHKIEGWSLQSRTRFEQRFSEAGDDVGFRLREFVRASWQPDKETPVGAVLWDEIFVGLNETDWGAPQGFDQNRLFVGPFVQLAPWARLEVGYLFTYVDRAAFNTSIHALAVNLFLPFKPAAAPPSPAAPPAPAPPAPAPPAPAPPAPASPAPAPPAPAPPAPPAEAPPVSAP